MSKQDSKQRKSKSKSAFAGLVLAVAILFGWCGRGFFLGDGLPGTESDEQESTDNESAAEAQPADDATPARCTIRVDAEGAKVSGTLAEVEDVIAACSASGEADLTVTGDARFGTADALRSKLEEAGIRVFEANRVAPATEPPAEP